MTDYTFKVGDKGKTRQGDDYEVTAVGRDRMLVFFWDQYEVFYHLDGTPAAATHPSLLPPTKRIQGWIAFGRSKYDGGTATSSRKPTREQALCYFKDTWETVAVHYIDIEEGEGLNND